MTPAARWRRLLPHLDKMGPDGQWAAAGFRRFFAGDQSVTLDSVFGFAPKAGQEHWRNIEARERRDAAIVELARFYPERTAETIATALARYGASAWRHDQALTAPPASYSNTAKEFLWRAYREGGGKVPTTARQIRTILGNETGRFNFRDGVTLCDSTKQESHDEQAAGPVKIPCCNSR